MPTILHVITYPVVVVARVQNAAHLQPVISYHKTSYLLSSVKVLLSSYIVMGLFKKFANLQLLKLFIKTYLSYPTFHIHKLLDAIKNVNRTGVECSDSVSLS